MHQSLQSAKEIHQFHHDVDELKGWMAEKEAVLDTEEDQDLHSIQTLMKQHEALEVRIFQAPCSKRTPVYRNEWLIKTQNKKNFDFEGLSHHT